MNTTLKEFGPSVQLWSMFGPLLIACVALAVIIRSAPGEWMLPLVAMGGIFICFRWGWLGFTGVSTVLLAAAAYQLSMSESEEWLWIIVLTLSIASSLVAALLFLDKPKNAWEAFDAHSEIIQGDIAKLQEQLHAAQGIVEAERQSFSAHRVMLHQQLVQKDDKLASYERLLALVREELSSGHVRQEKLIQDLSEARHGIADLEQRLAVLKAEASEEQRLQNELSIMELNDALSRQGGEVADLKNQLTVALDEERMYRRQAESYVLELVSLREELRANEEHTVKMQEGHAIQQSIIEELNKRVETLLREKQLLVSSLSKLQNQFDELKNQEQQKSVVVDSYLSAIEVLKTAVEQKQMELDREKRALEDVKKACFEKEQAHIKEVDDLRRLESRESRRFEGLYRQLREQFAEKSSVLDETRHELFYTQEMLAVMQRESDESQKFGNNCEEERLYAMLVSLEQEMILLERNSLGEIAALEGLVSSLTARDPNNSH